MNFIKKNKLQIIMFIIVLFGVFYFSAFNSYAVGIHSEIKVNSSTDAGFVDALKKFLKEYQLYLNIFLGFVSLTNLLLFIYNLVYLGKVSTNPQLRQEAIHNLLIVGIGFALIGGGALILNLIIFTFV